MLRGGNRDLYERQVEGIRRWLPDAGIRTSFITGFPGETEQDFDEVMKFIRNVQFDNVGVFLYSDEEGTRAFDLDGKVPRRTAERRRNQLMKEQSEISSNKLRQMIGKNVRVLLEGPSTESDLLLQARTETQAPDIDGHVLINDAGDCEPLVGKFYDAEITDSLEYDLIGKLL
jgi:ribosomal protein S12 methylthiotransferase